MSSSGCLTLRARTLALGGTLLIGLATAAAPASAAAPDVLGTGVAAAKADRALVVQAQRAAACRGACAPAEVRVQRAGRTSDLLHRRLAGLVTRASTRSAAVAPAPTLRVSGTKLGWSAIPGVRRYVLLRATPGQKATYSLVKGTATSPPATPGAKVRYAVRAATPAARWSAAKVITYRGGTAAAPAGAPATTTTPDTTTSTTGPDTTATATTSAPAASTSSPAAAPAGTTPVASAPAAASPAAPAATAPAASTPATAPAPAAPSAPSAPATPVATPAAPAKPIDAPSFEVHAGTMTWAPVSEVEDYVVVRKAAGTPDLYTVVRGTSWTPDPLPGKQIALSVRTAVDGSAWAPEQTYTYPASVAPAAQPAPTAQPAPAAPAPAPAPAPADTTPSASGFAARTVVGINSGSAINWELGFIKPLGARHVRMSFDADATPAEMAPTIEAYARVGIQPLLLADFTGRTPTVDEARNMGTWAAAFGPGGSFWAGKGYPASVQVEDIEFGNETNNPWQYSADGTYGDDWYKDPAFLQRAANYARRVKDAGAAVAAANAGVGVLAVGDQYAGYTTWVDAMFAAVPDLSSYVAGWTVHPYGPNWQRPMDTMLAAIHAHGGPDRPLYVTEWGLSTDDGRCLSDNYGWNKCMKFDEAAQRLQDAVGAMTSRYGKRLAAVYLYATIDQRPSGSDDDREHYFGAVRADGSAKGAYTSEVRDLLTQGA